jgi:hypothetical protein
MSDAMVAAPVGAVARNDVASPDDTGGFSPTRLLAIAAYVDKGFRDQALAMEADPYRAEAPAFGIDLPLILSHCRKARHWENVCFIAAGILVVAAVLAPSMIFLCWLLGAALIFVGLHNEYVVLTGELGPKSFKPAAAPDASARPNVVVYGAFSPFVGSGQDLGGWSFAVNLEHGKTDFSTEEPKPFDVEALYETLRRGFERLALPRLTIEDRLYVDGCSIRDDAAFLPGMLHRPVTEVERGVVDHYRTRPGRAARHYLCLEVTDWNGELVLSTFLRLQKTDSKLFIETSNFLLPPLKETYYSVDKRSAQPALQRLMGWAVKSVFMFPVLVIALPAAIGVAISRATEPGKRRREVEQDPRYNYGAKQSIRELGTSNNWRIYFQKLDKEMHAKIIQQQLLDVFVDFLDDHGIDTSEIKNRGTHILNNGVIVSGGSVSAQGLAVGAGAQTNLLGRVMQGVRSGAAS